MPSFDPWLEHQVLISVLPNIWICEQRVEDGPRVPKLNERFEMAAERHVPNAKEVFACKNIFKKEVLAKLKEAQPINANLYALRARVHYLIDINHPGQGQYLVESVVQQMILAYGDAAMAVEAATTWEAVFPCIRDAVVVQNEEKPGKRRGKILADSPMASTWKVHCKKCKREWAMKTLTESTCITCSGELWEGKLSIPVEKGTTKFPQRDFPQPKHIPHKKMMRKRINRLDLPKDNNDLCLLNMVTIKNHEALDPAINLLHNNRHGEDHLLQTRRKKATIRIRTKRQNEERIMEEEMKVENQKREMMTM